ncbi:unnamed protein product, partial [Rotaria sordida]
PQCNGIQIRISRDEQNENLYHNNTHIINLLRCAIQFDHSTNKWKSYGCPSALMSGLPEDMKKEDIISNLLFTIQRIQIQKEQQLIITTSNGEQVQLSRLQ